MTEAELQATILEMAYWFGWKRMHIVNSRNNPVLKKKHKGAFSEEDIRQTDPGFPDLYIAKPGLVIAAEVKDQKGRVAREQDWWLEVLASSKPRSYVWRPEHLDSGEIERILKGD